MAEGTEFMENADAGASHTHPETANTVRKGDVAMLKGHACKIVDFSSSKPGKHGAAKIKFCGLDVFDGKKYEEIISSTHNIDIPYLYRSEFTLVDVNEEGYLTLMDGDGNCREDMKLPTKTEPELAQGIQDGFNNDETLCIGLIKCLGQEKVVSSKPIS